MSSKYTYLITKCDEHKIIAYLQEDLPSMDIGGYVVGDKVEEAVIYFKGKGVLCGVPFVDIVVRYLDCSIQWLVEEGTFLDGSNENKIPVARIHGKCCHLLQAERTILNMMTRSSGIATLCRQAKQIADENGWHGYVAGTRKTTPGFRLVEKYSLIVGGIAPHRYDLSQMVMLKDNHIVSSGSITKAVAKAREAAGFSMKIEVECHNEVEAIEAANAGADIVMLDNMKPALLQEVASNLKKLFPYLLIEGSGNITMDTIHEYMCPEVDVLSSSKFTQGYSCVDISMKILHSH